MDSVIKFKKLGLSEVALKALKDKGFTEPTEVQAKCIPLILENNADIIGQAQTGTGKTTAFGLPILDLISFTNPKTQALILAPTRELAIQVATELDSLKGDKPFKIVPIYGGQSINVQFNALREGAHIVVGTPGRIMDHLRRKKLDFSQIKFFVLDEADEMLKMGFIEDVETILASAPQQKRVLLFSATMPTTILNLAKKYMSNHKHIEIKKTTLTVSLTEQKYFEVMESDKLEALRRIIDKEEDFYGLIFCQTKLSVDSVTHRLKDCGYRVEGIHGDVVQNQREKVLKNFKDRKIKILVATDVAARGIDINNLTHVVNYALPHDAEVYTHRIGRTGRAGKTGIALSLISPHERRKFEYMIQRIGVKIKKENLPEPQEIIEARKMRIQKNIEQIIDNKIDNQFVHFAQKLIQNKNEEKIIAALLEMAFKNDLDASNYHALKPLNQQARNYHDFAFQKRKKTNGPKRFLKSRKRF